MVNEMTITRQAAASRPAGRKGNYVIDSLWPTEAGTPRRVLLRFPYIVARSSYAAQSYQWFRGTAAARRRARQHAGELRRGDPAREPVAAGHRARLPRAGRGRRQGLI